jgi:hypothetical protein
MLQRKNALGLTVGALTLAATAPANAQGWWDTFKFSGHAEVGITFNPDVATNRLNIGRLFDDRANIPMLNQLLVTAERPIDPASPVIDFGFKLQGMFGSDARYTHFLGMLDKTIEGSRYQLDIVEANVQAHLPFLFAGGMDVKVGQFVTMEGIEVIPAPGNPLYSHSYIFNYGIPLKHTGIMVTSHISPMLDIHLGVTSGVNTTLFSGDNNSGASFHGGVGLNLLDGNLLILATTHIGPEYATEGPFQTPPAFRGTRFLNDVAITWKVNDKLTLLTDLNLIHDSGFDASAYGIAQYATYQFDDMFKFVVRGEIFRDSCNNGFCFVGAFPDSSWDFVDAQLGNVNTSFSPTGGKSATYGAITLGVNITPPFTGYFAGTVFRPEIRIDHALDGPRPFDTEGGTLGTSRTSFTLAADVIVPF